MRAAWLVPVVALALAGCAPAPKVGRVTGTVTVDGKPAEGVVLTFVDEGGRAATARSGPDGGYAVSDLAVGPATVTAYHPGGSAGEAAGMAMKNRGAESAEQRAREAPAKKKPSVVAPRYANPSSSGLRHTVTEGASEYDIKLLSK